MSICLGRRGWRMWSGLCLMLLNSVSSASSISWTIVGCSAGYKPAKQNQFCHHFNKVLCMYVSECRRWLRVGHGNGDVRCYVLVVSTWPRFAAIFLIVEFCVMSRDNWLFWCFFLQTRILPAVVDTWTNARCDVVLTSETFFRKARLMLRPQPSCITDKLLESLVFLKCN